MAVLEKWKSSELSEQTWELDNETSISQEFVSWRDGKSSEIGRRARI